MTVVWDKQSPGLGTNYMNAYELVGYFAKMPPQRNMTSGRKSGQRSVLKSNVFQGRRALGSDRQHNAAKPVDLIRYSIEPSTDKDALVVDWFAGSGSTILAAAILDRRCYAMEIEPKYVAVSLQRWADATGKTPVLADG